MIWVIEIGWDKRAGAAEIRLAAHEVRFGQTIWQHLCQTLPFLIQFTQASEIKELAKTAFVPARP